MTALHEGKLMGLLYKYRFYLLLITLLLNFFVPPLVAHPVIKMAFKISTTTCLLLSGTNFIDKGKSKLRNAWFAFGLINIAIGFAYNLNPTNENLENFQFFLLFLFFIVITVNLLQQIISIEDVDFDIIVGSFCGYLLLGIISFFLCAIVNSLIPHAFVGIRHNVDTRNSDLLYFAFTCLTTLGFGDILPTTSISQNLSVLTGAIGQFYIAVIVAILIGRFMREKKQPENIKKK